MCPIDSVCVNKADTSPVDSPYFYRYFWRAHVKLILHYGSKSSSELCAVKPTLPVNYTHTETVITVRWKKTPSAIALMTSFSCEAIETDMIS